MLSYVVFLIPVKFGLETSQQCSAAHTARLMWLTRWQTQYHPSVSRPRQSQTRQDGRSRPHTWSLQFERFHTIAAARFQICKLFASFMQIFNNEIQDFIVRDRNMHYNSCASFKWRSWWERAHCNRLFSLAHQNAG